MYATILLDTFILLLGVGAGVWLHAMHQRGSLPDLTPEERLQFLERELRDAREETKIMETIALNASDGLLIQDVTGRIQWSNPAYSRMTGYTAEEVRGRKPQELVVPPDVRPSPDEIEAFRYDTTSGVLDNLELVRNVRKNGEYFWNQLGFAVVEGEKDKEPRIIVMARDVTEQIEKEDALRKAKEAIQRRAETDILTSLPNRMKLNSFLGEALMRADQGDKEVGIIHLDLDKFKEVNDTLGHAAGDAVLVHAANVMTAHVRREDLVCRFGGDEFIIVCPGISEYRDLEEPIKRIMQDIKKPMAWGERKIHVGASIGLTISGPGNRDQQELMKQADTALYEVKNNGRNAVMQYSAELGRIVAQRTEISAALSNAISNNELGIMLQPQFDINAQKVIGFEALVRWNHPTRGLLVPGDFFDVAEKNGAMEDIDNEAIRGGLDALKALKEAGHEGLRISLNVSGRTLNNENYLDNLKWEVEKRGLVPGEVAIEVLETILFEGTDNRAAEAINQLSNAGFYVELDDFGTGYSGLTNLAQLKIQGVKIDRALMANVPGDETTQTVLKSIYRLCHDLGLSVIAEGIEEARQAAYLQRIGGEIIQGHGVARPMYLKQAIHWLETTNMQSVLKINGNRRRKSATGQDEDRGNRNSA